MVQTFSPLMVRGQMSHRPLGHTAQAGSANSIGKKGPAPWSPSNKPCLAVGSQHLSSAHAPLPTPATVESKKPASGPGPSGLNPFIEVSVQPVVETNPKGLRDQTCSSQTGQPPSLTNLCNPFLIYIFKRVMLASDTQPFVFKGVCLYYLSMCCRVACPP